MILRRNIFLGISTLVTDSRFCWFNVSNDSPIAPPYKSKSSAIGDHYGSQWMGRMHDPWLHDASSWVRGCCTIR